MAISNKSDEIGGNLAERVSIATVPGLISRGRWRIQSLQALPAHHFLWVTRGQGQIRVGTHLRGFGPNTILFIPAGLIHSLTFGANTLGYVARLPQSLPVPVSDQVSLIKATSIFEQGQMTGYFEQVTLESSSRDPGAEHAMESYMTLLTVWIERHQIRNDWDHHGDSDATTRLASKFLQRLEDNYQRGFSVATFAAVLGVTSTHLTRVCREVFGAPASKIVQERVVLAAKYALADDNVRVGVLAKSLGFTSPAYFTRLFHKHTSLSPKVFRHQAHSRSALASKAAITQAAKR